ncbi:MAG TPA: hypothetical protein VF274_09465 [Alphaproteobacteria bacterium]|jgi:hypothetical protein
MRPVLLVGSVPLEDAATVFSAAAKALGPLAARLPDGETGARRNWIGWQHAVFARVPQLEPTAERQRNYQLHPPFNLKPGAVAPDIDFGELGFAREALASWEIFERLKATGRVPAGCKFQVALPTAWAPVYSFIAYESQAAVAPVYEAALLGELRRILDAIPHDALAVQWDVATEMSWWERVYPAPFENVEEGVVDHLVRLGRAVPADVELGFHLCYGSMNNRHWKEPADTANLTAVANRLAAALDRPIGWLHLPVPIDRRDDAYFAPLGGLRLDAGTELYLGLLHLDDGVAGARARMAAAERHVGRFGIAAECGLGRVPRERVGGWLELHAAAAAAWMDDGIMDGTSG